jgi:hypothetical protein
MISANKLYQQSGTTLSFKDWLEREKAKGNFIPNANALEEYNNVDGNVVANKEEVSDVKDFTMVRNVAIVGAIIIFGYFLLKKK